MALALQSIQTNGISSSSATSVSVTGVNAAAGEILVVVANFGQFTGGNLPKPTIGAVTGVTWTERAYTAMAGSFGHAIVWTGVATQALSNQTITVTCNTTSNKSGAVGVYVLSGQHATTPVGGTGTKNSNGTNQPIDVTINVQAVGSYLLGTFQNGNGTTFTTRSDTTKDGATFQDNGSAGVTSAHLTSTTSATGNTTFGFTNSDTFALTAGVEIVAASGTTHDVTGAPALSLSAAGSAQHDAVLSGAPALSLAPAGSPSFIVDVVGAPALALSGAAQLQLEIDLSGNPALTFTTAGQPAREATLSGSAAMTAAASGELSRDVQFSGTSALAFSLSGPLTGEATHQLSGTAALVYLPSGDPAVGVSVQLDGAPSIAFVPSGAPSIGVPVLLSGSPSLSLSASSPIVVDRLLFGSPALSLSVAGQLSTGLDVTLTLVPAAGALPQGPVAVGSVLGDPSVSGALPSSAGAVGSVAADPSLAGRLPPDIVVSGGG